MNKLNKYSKTVTQDPTQPAAQAMLHAIGLTKEDFYKPIVGIASTGYEKPMQYASQRSRKICKRRNSK